MADVVEHGQNVVPCSGSAGPARLIRFCIRTACLAAAWLAVAWAEGSITTVNNVIPFYTSGGDPWNVGGELSVAYTAPGQMFVNAGSDVINTNGYIGRFDPGAIGDVTITGSGSTWKNTGDLWLGYIGVGHLTMSSSAAVYVGDVAQAGAFAGDLTVSGSSASGAAGGRLYVYNGSTITNTAGAGVIGDEQNEYGWATIDGLGSSWTSTGNLIVGNDGTGTLTISNGGSVQNADGLVANWVTAPRGTVLVTGLGSTWKCTGNLSLGRAGQTGVGQLTIADSGAVYVGDTATGTAWSGLVVSDVGGAAVHLYHGSTLDDGGNAVIGAAPGESGSVTVNGAGSTWTNSSWIMVGNQGSGSLTIQNGGSLSSQLCVLASDVGGTATVLVDGADSSWTNTEAIWLGDYGSATVTVKNGASLSTGWLLDGFRNSNSGQLFIQSGASVTSTNATLGCYSGATGTVTISGAGSTWETTVNLALGNPTHGSTGHVSSSGDAVLYVGNAASDRTEAGYLTISDTDGSGAGGGHVNIHTGSTFSHGGCAIIGDNAGEFGWVTVDGAGASWDNGGDLHVGSWGHGALTIANGGIVALTGSSANLHVGGGSGTVIIQSGGVLSNANCEFARWPHGVSHFTVTGNGSTWENTGNLWLSAHSFPSESHLTVSDGGTVYIGDAAAGGTAGWLTVSHSDDSGEGGVLYVYNGSSVDLEGGTLIGHGANEYGLVDVWGSSWTSDGGLYVGVDGSGTMTIAGNSTVSTANGWLAFGAGSYGVAKVEDAGSLWTANEMLVIGYQGSAKLTIQGGGSVSNTDGWLGLVTGGAGYVTVDGGSSTWECKGTLSLGNSHDSGFGELTLINGGTVYVGDAARNGGTNGWLTVSDADANGAAGGQLFIYNGSSIDTVGGVAIGDETGEYGWATVDGAGSVWNVGGGILVGEHGTGTLRVNNGGRLYNNGQFILGTYGSATLEIHSGGTMSNSDVWIGAEAGAIGEATVEGTGSLWTNRHMLCVGTDGSGSLTIQNHGQVTAADINIGHSGTVVDTGIITVDGGTLQVAGLLAIHETGRVDFSSGTVIIVEMINDPHGKFNWTGGRLSVATFQGTLYNPGGTLAPGGSAGLTEITWDYTQGAGGVLEIELFGTDASEYDRLHVNSLMTLSGILNVRLMGGFVPSADDTFDLLDWDYLSGTFDTLLLPELDGKLMWSADNLYATGALSVIPAVPGDANKDGEVNEQDAMTLAEHWGHSDCGWIDGDFNDDGWVNAADASILAANWGYGAGGESHPAVPEPAAWAMIVGLAIALAKRRSRDLG